MLKLIVILLTSISLNSFATECTKLEAQFTGVVTGFNSYVDDYAQTGYCSFLINIDIENYKVNQMCPLPYQVAASNFFSYDMRSEVCPASANGQKLSGYLVQKANVISIESIY